MRVAELLANATRELAASDARFYESAREAWRACRCAELAMVLETLAQTHGRPPLVAKTIKAWQAAWIGRVREGNPLDLPGLLSGLVERAVPRQASLIASCLDELARFADDPQLVTPLVAILAIEPSSSAWNKVHTRLFQLLEAANDPRAIAALEPAIAMSKTAPAWYGSMRDSLGRAERTRDRLARHFPDGVPPAPADLDPRELLAIPARAFVSVVRVDELDALYQAVLEEPDDDDRRAVYADALQQRGDPRGEIIALQLAGTAPAKAKAERLIEKHRKTLLGAIARTVSTAVFEKGFLVACETDVRRVVEAEVVFGRAEWATVKRLTFGKCAALSSAMRSLEEAYRVPESALAALHTITLPKLRVLDVTGVVSLVRGEPRGALGALASTRGLPALRELRLDVHPYEYERGIRRRARTAEDFAWLLSAPVAQQLARMAVTWEGDAPDVVRSWLDVLRARPLEALTLWSGSARLVLEKRGGTITATNHGTNTATLRDVLAGISMVTPPAAGP